MKIKFLGAAREVTGSNYLLEVGSSKLLVDCGLFQGSRTAEEKNYQDFLFDPKTIDALALTHAHLDHCGRIPKLLANGFKGKVYSTAATLELSRIVLEDFTRLMLEESDHSSREPLYTLDDLSLVFDSWQTVDYHETVNLGEARLTFFDAGHILGSALVKVETENQTIGFSGDLGNPPAPILRKPETVDNCNSFVIESTYGGRVHETAPARTKILEWAIEETIARGGTLMIPAFAVERTQELLYELNFLIEQKQIARVPVFLDSPMAIKTTEVFHHFGRLFNSADQNRFKFDDLFNFPGLELTKTVWQSKKINSVSSAKIIIAGSGMMEGGRILHHAKRYLSDERNMLLIVGYQVAGSLGRSLLDGSKTVKIHGENVKVRAKIKAVGAYSAHGDQPKLVSYIGDMRSKPKKIYITHGEFDQSKALADKISRQFSIDCEIPEYGFEAEL